MSKDKPDIFSATVQELNRVVFPATMRELWHIEAGDIVELKICGVHKKEA
jgi:bifunctional DNA-binding transcriptional regulator/antitoxin component of YhaV-PrlF toxin-antitoxin module